MTSLFSLRLLYILLYFFIAAQAAYFLLGYFQVLRQMDTEAFLTIRRSTDSALRWGLKFVYLAALAAGIALLFVEKKELNVSTALLWTSFLLLLADVVLVKTGSEPLNKEINALDIAAAKNAALLQKKWLDYIFIRGAIILAGFLLLLIRTIPKD